MLRNLIAAIAVCSLVASGSAQVVKPPMTVPKFVEAFRAIEKETRAKSNAIVEKASAADESAKTEVARAKIWKEANAEIETITAPAVRKVFDLAKPNAAEKAACEALVWVVRHQSNGELGLAAVALLKEHHLVRKETIELAKSMKQSAM